MRVLSVILLSAALAAEPATAQSRPQPSLMLTLYGGAAAGRDLWRVDHQLLTHLGGQPEPDTVNLDRGVASAVVLGSMFTLYGAGAWGASVDFDYRSVTLDDTCVPAAPFQPDPAPPPETGDLERNRHLCDNIRALSNSGSAIGIAVAVSLRLASRAALSPYLRAGGRFTNMTISTIALEAEDGVSETPRLVINDPSPRRSTVGFLLAAGLTSAIGPGYQFRLEVRDHIHSIALVRGPANGIGEAPTGSKMFHHPSLVVALDVVLEHRRGRRY